MASSLLFCGTHERTNQLVSAPTPVPWVFSWAHCKAMESVPETAERSTQEIGSEAGSHGLEMAQKAQALATKPNKLCSIPRTYVVERLDSQRRVLCPRQAHAKLYV